MSVRAKDSRGTLDTGVRGPRHGRQPILHAPDGTPLHADAEFADRYDTPPVTEGTLLVATIPLGATIQVISECRHGRRQHFHAWEAGGSRAEIVARHIQDHREEVNAARMAAHVGAPGTVADLCGCRYDPPMGALA